MENIHNDFIMGIQWINSIGRFTIDDPTSIMYLNHKGQEITLKGLPIGSGQKW